MKKLLLTLTVLLFLTAAHAQCSITPNAATFILSPYTVGATYTLNSNNAYALQRAFYICQGTQVTIQNRPGNDTFYVETGAQLIGSEPNLFRVFLKSGSAYNAMNSGTATIYYETGATISNYTGPMLPPCPALTISMAQIGSGACGPTAVPEQDPGPGLVLLFPNPVKDECTVSIYKPASEGMITVFDMLGNRVKQLRISANSSKLDVSDLVPGIYFVEVKSSGTVLGTVRLVRQ
jgi:hypothetical protein